MRMIFAQQLPPARADSALVVPPARADSALAAASGDEPELAERLEGFLAGLSGFWYRPWFQEMGLLLVVVLLAWLPSRAVVRWLVGRRKVREEEVFLSRFGRSLLDASVWPILSMLILAPVLALGRQLFPENLSESYRVLPILGFFLLYRVLNLLIKEFVPEGGRRRRLRRVFLPGVFLLAALQQLGLLGGLQRALSRPLFSLGDTSVSTMSLLAAFFAVVLFTVMARVVGQVIGRNFLPGMGMDRALSEALGTVTRYVLVILGLLVAIDSIGFDLSAIKIAFGALGVGIGFGLQNIVNNFTSGLILLFERTVKRGDILEVAGETHGRVMNIGLRSSVMRTREGDDIIVPNSHLVENQVINYSFRDTLKRIDVNIGVSYASDPHQVKDVLLACVEGLSKVKQHPPPSVVFKAFGESSLDFQLRVWVDDPWIDPLIRSELLFRAWDALKQAGVEIPFPQRDLHIRSGELPVRRLEP